MAGVSKTLMLEESFTDRSGLTTQCAAHGEGVTLKEAAFEVDWLGRYMEYTESMITTIRKSGNSFVIRVPREEMERAGVQVDEHVLVEIRPIEIRPRLTPRLQAVAEDILARPGTARAFARLADG